MNYSVGDVVYTHNHGPCVIVFIFPTLRYMKVKKNLSDRSYFEIDVKHCYRSKAEWLLFDKL